MDSAFPIPIPERLPSKIDPCPIVEANLEMRFVTSESWRTLPGLLFARIRERYPEQKDLPLARVDEEIRRLDPAFTYQPLIQFFGRDFLIQFGPRVVGLATKPNAYPGWAAVEEEIVWLLDILRGLDFITEGERLGVRYINFFALDIFDQLLLEISTGGKRLGKAELSIATVLRRPPFAARLQVVNSAILGTGNDAKVGSVFDVDVWLGSLDFDIFDNSLARLREAHEFEKQIFFGLLNPEFLTTLNPVFE
jgi:uncharacterized protein (TIGR04255 family)